MRRAEVGQPSAKRYVRDDVYPIPEHAKKGTARVTQAAIPKNVDSLVRSPTGTPSRNWRVGR